MASEAEDVKIRPHLVLLLALVAAFTCSLAVASSASAAAEAPAKQAATAKQDDAADAAARRAAGSEFEREKLDPKAFAEDGDKASGKDAKKDDSGGGSLFRFLFGLVVVLAVIFGVHWLLKRWGQSRMQGVIGTSGIIDVVATTPLAQGRALHVVRVGQELVLVGATEQSITRIADLDANALGAQAANLGNGEFQAMLSGAMIGTQPGVPAGMGGAGSTKDPFMKRFLDNLRMTTAR